MKRARFLRDIRRAFRAHPIVGLLGPRQCGKTTLARMFADSSWRPPGPVHRFDLEDPTDLARLEVPKLALQDLEGLVIIDEVQRVSDLFPVLRVLVDRPARKPKARFLILGSASRDLIRQGSESLAGRIRFIELTPFSMVETGAGSLQRLWLRGGFPPSFLARFETRSAEWRKGYIASYLERDIPSLGFQIPAAALRRFWLMLTHSHGQVFNASEIGRSLGVADTTVRRYLDILTGTFMVRQLVPWVEHIAKRQVKSPKIYFRDSGMFHTLLGVHSYEDLRRHPKLGASWEGFALEEILRARRAAQEEAFFWATHAEAELDLMIVRDGGREGYEIKFTDRPRVTKSMRMALQDLRLDRVTVIFPGDASFSLDKRIEAVGLEAFLTREARRESER